MSTDPRQSNFPAALLPATVARDPVREVARSYVHTAERQSDADSTSGGAPIRTAEAGGLRPEPIVARPGLRKRVVLHLSRRRHGRPRLRSGPHHRIRRGWADSTDQSEAAVPLSPSPEDLRHRPTRPSGPTRRGRLPRTHRPLPHRQCLHRVRRVRGVASDDSGCRTSRPHSPDAEAPRSSVRSRTGTGPLGPSPSAAVPTTQAAPSAAARISRPVRARVR